MNRMFVLLSNGMLHTIHRPLRKKAGGCDVMKVLMELKDDTRAMEERDEHGAPSKVMHGQWRSDGLLQTSFGGHVVQHNVDR